MLRVESSDYEEWCVLFRYFLFYLGFGGGVILFYYGRYCGYFYIVGYEVI